MKDKYEPQKVVKTAPLTELEKPLNISFAGSKKKVRKNKQIFVKCVKSASDKKRDKQHNNQANSEKNSQKINHMCIQCHTNPTWLDYSICYECYIKNINEKKQKSHWVGGRLNPVE